MAVKNCCHFHRKLPTTKAEEDKNKKKNHRTAQGRKRMGGWRTTTDTDKRVSHGAVPPTSKDADTKRIIMEYDTNKKRGGGVPTNSDR